METWRKSKMELLPNSKKFKILQLSNAWDIPSGYGVASKGTLFEWNKHYDVRQLAFYGNEGRMRAYQNPHDPYDTNWLQVYPPLPGDTHGDRTARLIFATSPWKPDLFVTLYDIWMGAYVDPANTPEGFEPIHPHWIPVVMVDHDPIPETTLVQARLAFRVVTPSQFGVKEFARNGVDALHIPFGCDTNVYKPIEDKAKLKPWLGKRAVPFDTNKQTPFTEDSFIIFMNGANKDPYRKAFMRMFQAIRIFLNNNPDAEHHTRVYVHSWMKQSRDIPHGAKVLKIQHLCKATSDPHNLCAVPDAIMNKFYGAADIFMHLSEGGGFEIPILEALSCGLPVIGSDFVGMNELVDGHGWSIPMKTTYYSPLDATQGIADEYKAAEALEDAYNHPEKRDCFGKAGREFALKFDWKQVNPLWIRLFESIRREWRQTSAQERVI
jgi:glycosyltransferase involved in cell wall biosynthesis